MVDSVPSRQLSLSCSIVRPSVIADWMILSLGREHSLRAGRGEVMIVENNNTSSCLHDPLYPKSEKRPLKAALKWLCKLFEVLSLENDFRYLSFIQIRQDF